MSESKAIQNIINYIEKELNCTSSNMIQRHSTLRELQDVAYCELRKVGK
ncbi:hypothetical protein [Clostridium butyricum]